MVTPLKNWGNLKRGYTFRQRTFYSRHHLGLDLICKKWTYIYAPCDGFVEKRWGFQGGNTIYFYFNDKTKIIMRVLHLADFEKLGKVKEGDIIGYVGNTGALSRGSHAHIDLSKNKVDIHNINNFIDPELFFNNKDMLKLKREKGREEVFAVINGRNYYIGSTAFNDMLADKIVQWEDVEEVDEVIYLQGIIK